MQRRGTSRAIQEPLSTSAVEPHCMRQFNLQCAAYTCSHPLKLLTVTDMNENMLSPTLVACCQQRQDTQTGGEGRLSATSGPQPTPCLQSQTNREPFPTESRKDSLLWIAVIEGKIEEVRIQLEQGADVNAKFKHGWTALLQAVQMEWEDIVHFLLEWQADPFHRKENGATPFIIAGILGNEKLLKLFLSKGADLNEMDYNGFTALMEAALYGHEQAVQFLLDKGADVNVERRATDEGKSKSSGGTTALMDAAKKGNESILRMLIDKGASVNHRDLHGRSALHHALSSPELTMESTIRILMDSGAEVNVRASTGKTALFRAVEMRRPGLVKALLEKDGIEVDIQDDTGRSALQVAVRQNDYETATLLLESGANPKDSDLILEALTKYNPSLVKLLLQYGAVVDANGNPTNWTPVSRRWGDKLRKLHDMKHPLKGKLKIFVKDEYRIQGTSGVGVYVGIYDGHEVAVKMTVKKGSNEKFLQEQRCLNHFQGRSHTVKLLGTEEDDSCLYLCLMLCEKNIEEHVNMSPVGTDIKDILRDIFRALEDLHHSSFVHQDVCPANILIDYRGKGYLADFDKTLRFEDSVPNAKRELIKGDMKGLADLVLYVVTGGQIRCVPEGQDVTEVYPDVVENSNEARDLIRKLLAQDEEHQTVKDFFKHPFFWSQESKFKFLQDIGNESDIKTVVQCPLAGKLNCQDAIEGKQFQNWTSKIDEEVLNDMNKRQPQKYRYQDTITSLLKFIRNVGVHFQDKSEQFQRIVKHPGEYFLERFPDLTLYVYDTIRCSEEKKHLLEPYGFSMQI